MALPTYQLNSIPTVEEFNAFLRPKFNKNATEEEFPGSLRRLTDDALANEAGNVKPQWQGFRDELLVTAGTGLSVNYRGGRVGLLNGNRVTIAPGTLAIPDNATSFIFVDETGAVRASATRALRSLELATVTTGAGQITGLVNDQRLRGYEVRPRGNAIRVFGGSGDEGDKVISGSETLDQGEYYYRSLTLNATGLINVRKIAVLNIANDCLLNGGIAVSPASLGGPGDSTFGTGATNGQGYLISSVVGQGAGAGKDSSPSDTYNYMLSLAGSGGGSTPALLNTASTGVSPVVTTGKGGDGGGALVINCAGMVTLSAAASIIARGTNGLPASGTSYTAGGSGGGSGGLILIRALGGIRIAGTLDVRGGNGSAGTVNAMNNGALGGGGGGGGLIALIAPADSINTTGSTILLTAGTAGATVAPSGGSNRGGASGGSFGGLGGNGFPTSTAGAIGQLIIRNFLAVG